MKVSGDWISHPGTQELCAALVADGYQALFVGGCVRNALMGVEVADIDLATDALPETVSNIAEKAGFRSVQTGIEHGTVTVIAHGRPHEVTTFRRDVATDGRHAVVSFSLSLAEDAARRDFTMNALYADASGAVIDPLGGLTDVLAHRVRFVGDPEHRIREDYLRILRFFRFHAVYGDPKGGFDADGLAACAANSAGIGTLSRERVGGEMRKLLSAADPAPSVASMAQAGVLARVLPGADPRSLAPLIHLEQDVPVRWRRRLVVLGGEDVATALRLSRQEAADHRQLTDAIGATHGPAALGWRLGPDLAGDSVMARAAMLEAPLPPDWLAEIARGAATPLPVTAADFMPGLTGQALGARLRAVEERWLASDLRLTRADLLG